MYLVGIRNDVLESDPRLAPAIFEAFEAARRHAVHELHQVAYDLVMLT